MKLVAQKRVKPRGAAVCHRISQCRLKTIQDLLDIIQQREPKQGHLRAMLCATAAHISMHLQLPCDKLDISALLDVRAGLQLHLRERGFKRNSIRSYANFLRILLQKARDYGWSADPETGSAWDGVFRALASYPSCLVIVRYAIVKGLRPDQFSEDCLQDWAETSLRDGWTYKRVLQVKRLFRKRIFEARLSSHLPCLHPPATGRIYGIPLSEFPPPLRSEVLDLLKWKTDTFSPGRPYRAHHREVTANNLKKLLCRLYGFLVNKQGAKVDHLEGLFSQGAVCEFAKWAINHRGVSGRCVALWLGTIRALRIYPRLSGLDFGWVPNLVAELPNGSEERAKERKERRWVPYDVLARVPDQILRDANRKSDLDERAQSLAFRDALLIRWLVILPWRQRNLRECKILSFREGGNLYKDEIPPSSTLAKPLWLQEVLHSNPRATFWQFRFRPEETKNGRPVHAVLPRQLIEPLENYITFHRPRLINGTDPGTLFVNDHGTVFDPSRLGQLIGDVTLKYAQQRMNPHLCRDIFALKWLETCPEDYLTLSKILWHHNIQTTLKTYGARFDESHATRRIEEWLDGREPRAPYKLTVAAVTGGLEPQNGSDHYGRNSLR